MNEKESPDIFSKEDFAYMATLNERQKRQYKASVALHQKEARQSIRKISKKMGTSKNTIYRGIAELRDAGSYGDGRVRKAGGGRKALLPRHPEWIELFLKITEPYRAGLPQDENDYWISLSVPQIRKKMNERVPRFSLCRMLPDGQPERLLQRG